MWQEEFRSLLRTEFTKQKEVDFDFSLSKFARMAGVSVGTMSELINGKRDWRITGERAAEILDRLPLSPAHRNRILVQIGSTPKFDVVQLSTEKLEFLLNWKHQALVMALDLPPSERTMEKLAERFALSFTELSTILNTALLHELVTLDAQGHYQRNQAYWKTSDNIPNELLRRHSIASASRIKKAVENLSTEERDCTSLTFVGSRQQMSQVRSEIRDFYKRLSSLMSDENSNDEVFELAISLYPLNKKME